MKDGALLEAEEVSAGYGKMEILHGVSLAVRPGEMVSVIGPNGAGKSTAFKTIVGLLHPRTHGEAHAVEDLHFPVAGGNGLRHEQRPLHHRSCRSQT